MIDITAAAWVFSKCMSCCLNVCYLANKMTQQNFINVSNMIKQQLLFDVIDEALDYVLER